MKIHNGLQWMALKIKKESMSLFWIAKTLKGKVGEWKGLLHKIMPPNKK